MKIKLSLRQKVILPALVLALVVSGIITAVLWQVATSNFLEIEKSIATTDLKRVINVINNLAPSTGIKASDWANWDDSYNFVTHPTQEFIRNNLSPSAVSILKINLIAYLNAKSQIVNLTYVDTSTATEATPPADLVQFLSGNPKFAQKPSADFRLEGIIPLKEGPFILASRTITKSDYTGDFVGTIVFGRFLDSSLVAELSQTTAVPFTIITIPKPPLTAIHSVEVVDFSHLSGKTSYPDINGVNQFEIRVTFPRTLNSTSLRFLQNTIAAVILCIAGLMLVLVQILSATTIKPVVSLAGQVNRLTSSKDPSARVNSGSSNDEISQVADSINTLLSQLEQNKQILEEKVQSSQKQNLELDSSRQAMLNLLEDARTLENDLKKERDRAQTIISSLGEGVIVIDKDFHIVLINQTAAQLLETTPEKAIGKLWLDLAKVYENENNVPTEERTFHKVVTTGKPIVTTLQDNHYYCTNSGHKFPISAVTTPLTSSDGQVVGAVKVFRDITAEKEASHIIEQTVIQRTQELRWEKARMTTSINSLPNGFILTDPQNNILIINQSALKILNLPDNTSLLSDIEKQFPADFNLHSAITNCLNDQHPLHVPEIAMGSRFIRLFISPIFVTGTSADSYVGSALLITDITEQKVLERSKEEFFSIASHELRTPLTAIRGNTSLMLEYYTAQLTDPELLRMVGDIHESSIRLIDIVNDFLDVSRLEQSRIQFKKSNFDIAKLAQEVITELNATTPPPPVPLVLTLPSFPLPQVFADHDRSKQVFFNLIGNALKFTTSGKIEITFALANPTLLEIFVTDTGHGIPVAQQNLLFHKFQQAGENLFTRDASHGTGLGLYISKLIVEGMGGKVSLVKSEPGVGSTFSFTLPVVASS